MTVGNPALWNICKLLGEKILKVLITREKPFVFLLFILNLLFLKHKAKGDPPLNLFYCAFSLLSAINTGKHCSEM